MSKPTRYTIEIDQTVEGDASDCIVNAIKCVDDDHWRDAPPVKVTVQPSKWWRFRPNT